MSAVSVTLTFASLEEAITNLAKLRASDAKVEAAPTPKLDKAAKTAAPAATSPSATPAAAPATPETASGIPYETVVKAISAAAANPKDKPKAIEVLKTFGAKNGKELIPGQYADFLASLEKAMAPEESLT
jgi:pectin methylesterase-like acyl-CoA thioesterase